MYIPSHKPMVGFLIQSKLLLAVGIAEHLQRPVALQELLRPLLALVQNRKPATKSDGKIQRQEVIIAQSLLFS
jgi:hypothetical protein